MLLCQLLLMYLIVFRLKGKYAQLPLAKDTKYVIRKNSKKLNSFGFF